jgi:hypothetical protein
VSSSVAASSSASVQERVQQKLRERLEERQQKATSSAMKADGSQSGLPLLSSLGSSSSAQSVTHSVSNADQITDAIAVAIAGEPIQGAAIASASIADESSLIPVAIVESSAAQKKPHAVRTKSVIQYPQQHQPLAASSSSALSPSSRPSRGPTVPHLKMVRQHSSSRINVFSFVYFNTFILTFINQLHF